MPKSDYEIFEEFLKRVQADLEKNKLEPEQAVEIWIVGMCNYLTFRHLRVDKTSQIINEG